MWHQRQPRRVYHGDDQRRRQNQERAEPEQGVERSLGEQRLAKLTPAERPPDLGPGWAGLGRSVCVFAGLGRNARVVAGLRDVYLRPC